MPAKLRITEQKTKFRRSFFKQLGTVLSVWPAAPSAESVKQKVPNCLIIGNRRESFGGCLKDVPQSGSNTWCHASRGLTHQSHASYHPRCRVKSPPCGSSAPGHSTWYPPRSLSDDSNFWRPHTSYSPPQSDSQRKWWWGYPRPLSLPRSLSLSKGRCLHTTYSDYTSDPPANSRKYSSDSQSLPYWPKDLIIEHLLLTIDHYRLSC